VRISKGSEGSHATNEAPEIVAAAARRSRRPSLSVLAAVLALSCAGTHSIVAAANARTEPGAALYRKYCATCHGDRGQGYAADRAPSLATSTFLESATDEFLGAAIERGRPGTAMAGYGREVGGPLDAGQVRAIIAFLRANAPAAKLSALPPDGATGSVSEGLRIYFQACVSCHGTQTRPGTAVHLFNPFFLETTSDAYLSYAITRGRPGTDMQPWSDKLSPAEIAGVVAYLRSAAPARGSDGKAAGSGSGPGPEWQQVVLNPGGRPASLRPRGQLVAMAQVKQALDEKRRIVILDTRAPSDWRRLRIPGALSLPYYDLSRIDRLPKDGTWIVAYCACPHHLSGIVVEELRKRGYEHAAVLDEGILAWQQAGYPVYAASDKAPLGSQEARRPPGND
jgi:mono/diheme cytochrome c family protein/rhodanese-related sulfurtransferase